MSSRFRLLVQPKPILILATLGLLMGQRQLPAVAQTTLCLSLTSGGTAANNTSAGVSLSHDGAIVAFESDATNLLAGNFNPGTYTNIYARVNGVPVLISKPPTGGTANGASTSASLSADGRKIAYQSLATNLDTGGLSSAGLTGIGGTAGNNGFSNIFVQSLPTGLPKNITSIGNGDSGAPSLSANGRYVAFVSAASNLATNDTNGVTDVFVYDAVTQKFDCVSRASDGTQANGASSLPSISSDGRYVAYVSAASNLVQNDNNHLADIFLTDRKTRRTIRVSTGLNGVDSNGQSYAPTISANGRFVAYSSVASNLVSGDTNGFQDVFVYDRRLNTTELISQSVTGDASDGDSYTDAMPSLSADGRYVAYTSSATNLIANDTNLSIDAFVYDRTLHTTNRVSVGPNAIQSNSDSLFATISLDGRVSAYNSDASNLIRNDTNAMTDVFARNALVSASESGFHFDLFLQNSSTGAIHRWVTNGQTIVANNRLFDNLSGWIMKGTGDFGGEGDRWVIFQKTDGTPYLWRLSPDGSAIAQSGAITLNGAAIGSLSDWNIVAIADLDNDGKDDLILQNKTNGGVYVWHMNGFAIASHGSLWSGGDSGWQVFAVTDLDADGTPDILLQNGRTGQVYRWILAANGGSIASSGFVYSGNLGDWRAKWAGDVAHDGTVNVVFQNATSGAVYVWSLTNGVISGQGLLWAGGDKNWQVASFADVDGDTHADLLFQYAGTGSVFAWTLDGLSITSANFLYSGNLAGWNLIGR